jgi:hypothetical protein
MKSQSSRIYSSTDRLAVAQIVQDLTPIRPRVLASGANLGASYLRRRRIQTVKRDLLSTSHRPASQKLRPQNYRGGRAGSRSYGTRSQPLVCGEFLGSEERGHGGVVVRS